MSLFSETPCRRPYARQFSYNHHSNGFTHRAQAGINTGESLQSLQGCFRAILFFYDCLVVRFFIRDKLQLEVSFERVIVNAGLIQHISLPLPKKQQMLSVYSDEHFMKEALKEAQKAFEADEVPIGAVVVCEDRIIARAHNLSERLNDVTAHAEMQAITAAANYLGSKFLDDCTLYVTIEPCVMCAGALYWARMSKLMYGAPDEKKGYSKVGSNLLHPKTKVEAGLLEEQCGELMKVYFRNKR